MICETKPCETGLENGCVVWIRAKDCNAMLLAGDYSAATVSLEVNGAVALCLRLCGDPRGVGRLL